MVLAVLSTIGGFIGIPEVMGGSNWFRDFLSPIIGAPTTDAHALSHETEWILMGLSVAAVATVIVITYIIYVSKKSLPANDGESVSGLQKTLSHKYYIDEIYDTVFIKPFYMLSNLLHQFVEIKFIDSIVNGLGTAVTKTSTAIRFVQDGSLSFYLFAMVAGIIMILFFNTVI